MWDLSAMALANYEYYAVFSTESGFPNATHSNSAYIEIEAGIKYQSKFMYAVESSGIKTYGERIPNQTFSLTDITGGSGDKVEISAQDIVYSAPQVQLPYPATIGTKWSSTSNSKMNMKLTISLVGYNNADAERKTITTTTNEVVGYGMMRVKRLDGKASGSKPVLMVKTTIAFKDSLLVNGASPNALLLQAIGFQQGQVSSVYQHSFYREQEMLPMVNVRYEDATFSKREDVNVHSQRLPWPDGVDRIDAVVAEIFPNPSNGTFTVRVDEGKGKWAYSVADVTGKVISTSALNLNGNKATVALNVAPGTYIITVQNDGVAVSGQKIVVQ